MASIKAIVRTQAAMVIRSAWKEAAARLKMFLRTEEAQIG